MLISTGVTFGGLGSSDCHDKEPKPGGLEQQKCTVLEFWGWKSEIRCGQGMALEPVAILPVSPHSWQWPLVLDVPRLSVRP